MTDEQRDAHLREALRHAPDAQVQPPTALSALILSEARAKARDAKPSAPPRRHPLLALWDGLSQPWLATGLAGVMAATLVGMMWWDQPMDEAQPRRPAPATAATPAIAPPAAAVPQEAPAQPPVASAPVAPRPTAANDALQRKLEEPPRSPARRTAPESEADKNADGALEKKKIDKAEVAAPPPAPVLREEAPAAPQAMAPLPTSPPAAAAAADATSATAGALAKPGFAERPVLSRSAPAPVPALREPSATRALAGESRLRQEAAPRARLASVRAAIAAEPARWSWQRGDGTVRDMNDALYAWLAQADSASGVSWQPRAARDTSASTGRELRLLRDGRVVHSLRITDRGLHWDNDQSAWQAELPADQLNALLTALDAVAP